MTSTISCLKAGVWSQPSLTGLSRFPDRRIQTSIDRFGALHNRITFRTNDGTDRQTDGRTLDPLFYAFSNRRGERNKVVFALYRPR